MYVEYDTCGYRSNTLAVNKMDVTTVCIRHKNDILTLHGIKESQIHNMSCILQRFETFYLRRQSSA